MARFSLLLLLLAAVSASAQPAKSGGLRLMGMTADELAAAEPASPNPFLAFLAPGVTPDFEYWTAKTALDGVLRARTRALRGLRAGPSVTYRERERAVFNRNDTEPERLSPDVFGSAFAEPRVEVTGVLETPAVTPTPVAVSLEDGAGGAVMPFRIAVTAGVGTVASARIGDGPFGATSGDVDVYEITIPEAGTYVEIAARTPAGGLDPVMALYGPYGEWVFSADDSEGSLEPVEARVFETPGTYRLFVWGFGTDGLADRTDASTGSGAGSTGPYELLVTSAAPDVDLYAVELLAGDVLAVVTSAPVEDLALFGPDGSVRMRSQTDISGLYPADGPLLSPAEMGAIGRGISAATIAPTAGTYTIAVQGEGAYRMMVQGARPGHERPGGQAVQTIYVEMNGGTYYPSRELAGTRDTTQLSPLRTFLPRWGLAAADEDAVVDTILETIGRVLRNDLRALPGMSGLDLRILNDRDHPDPGPGVNRLILAGTQPQIGAEGFLGQASTVDVGNFRQDDVAYILLDLMSDPDGTSGSSSINQFAVDSTRTKAELVGLGVGTVAAHEAGHFFGLHHTDNANATRNVQDAGGYDLALGFDIGADRVFGPGDGRGVRFRPDELFRSHAFSGIQRSPEALAFGLHSTGRTVAAATDDLLRAHGFSVAARAAASAQPRQGRLSLAEDFDTDELGWTWTSTSSASSTVVTGGALTATSDGGKTLRVPFKSTGGAVGLDLAVRFDLRHASGCTNNGAGASVRFVDGAYSALLMDAAGDAWSTVDRWTGDTWAPIAAWERTDAIASDVWNTVEVVVIGSQARLVVNGQTVREATVPTGAGVSGLLVRACDNPMAYAFDNLTVVALDAPGVGASGVRSFGAPAAVPAEADAPGLDAPGDE